MSQQLHWIPVEASDGGFSTERAIALKLADGKRVSLFADKNLLREESNRTFLQVTLVRSFPNEKKELVLLPTETFETASPWAEIATR